MQLSSNHGHAWANSEGEMIFTDDDGFDPNTETDSTLEWRRMQAR